jgi:hypothetical protein
MEKGWTGRVVAWDCTDRFSDLSPRHPGLDRFKPG